MDFQTNFLRNKVVLTSMTNILLIRSLPINSSNSFNHRHVCPFKDSALMSIVLQGWVTRSSNLRIPSSQKKKSWQWFDVWNKVDADGPHYLYISKKFKMHLALRRNNDDNRSVMKFGCSVGVITLFTFISNKYMVMCFSPNLDGMLDF